MVWLVAAMRLSRAASAATQHTLLMNRFAVLSHPTAAKLLKQEDESAAKASDRAPQTSTPSTSRKSSSVATVASGDEKKGRLQEPLVWVDLEMTGLDLAKDTIIEIAVIITDGQLQRTIQGPAFAIHQTDEVLDGMNEWCKVHHGASGLTQRVRESSIGMQEAEQQVLAFIQEHIPEPRVAQLAGNSVHVDRMFLHKYMPELVEHLHYRIVDVSTIKELVRRWYPKDYRTAPRKVLAHTALSDIQESIEELRHWRRTVFKQR